MRNGRIESYLHSDDVTENKGGAIVCVTIKSDFAARTKEFIGYTKRVAKMAYAASFMEEVPEKITATVEILGDDSASGAAVVPMSVDGHNRFIMNKFIEDQFPEMKTERELIEKELKEPITIEDIKIIKL